MLSGLASLVLPKNLGIFRGHTVFKKAFLLGFAMTSSDMPPCNAQLTVREILKGATDVYHDQLNRHSLLVGLTQPGYSLERYRTLLFAYHHIYDTLEAQLFAFQRSIPQQLDYSQRIKLPWISRDLAFLGIDLPVGGRATMQSIDAAPVTSVGVYTGVLYVIEGSMLGGQLISRSLETNLGLRRDAGARFYYGYGRETGAMWQAFLGFAEGIRGDERECRAAEQAACQTFKFFINVLEHYADC